MHAGTILPYRAYRQLAEDDPNKYEMIWRVLYVAASPRFQHQDVLAALIEHLRRHVRERQLGRVVGRIDLYRNELKYVQPDVSFFTPDQVPPPGEQAIRTVPSLVVEILSVFKAKKDREEKRCWYADLGVREYWLVDVEVRRIKVIDLVIGVTRAGDPVLSAVLPDVRIWLSMLFA